MDHLPPPMTLPYPPQPIGQKNWWQRNWMWFVPTGCVSLLLLLAIGIGGIMFAVFSLMKASDPYKIAVERAKSNAEVTEALGTPVSEGMFVSGNIKVSGGSGNADFSIPLSGPKGKATIYVVGTKSEDQWNYSKMNVRLEGTGTDVDLRE